MDHQGILLKPDVDNAEEFLWLNPDGGKLETRSEVSRAMARRVERTIELCDLQRGALCTKRIEAMLRTIHWLERVAELKGRPLDLRLERERKALFHPGAEHKFVIRHVFELKGEPRLAAYDRQEFDRAQD
ncbi:MAG: hypothetical protein ABI995_12760 [Acidobacteriota bacterium]